MKRKILLTCLVLLVSAALVTSSQALEPIEELGRELFFDQNLSVNGMQACATCHAPETGFTGPDSEINSSQAIYPGAILTRTGNRKPPTAAYGGDSPVLSFDEWEGLWIGGMFWDGRATGERLGDPLAEQAQGPFLNPLEQAAPTAQLICLKVQQSSYANLFIEVWRPIDSIDSIDCAKKADVASNYERIARSIAAYERSDEVNPFSSKYDYYLAGEVDLTPQEVLGLELFEGKAMCSACHLSDPVDQDPPLFTDFTYDNLGVPKNPANPFYNMPRKWNPDGADWIDLGLGGFLSNLEFVGTEPPASLPDANMGKQKVPTLRNVDKRPDTSFVKAYGHNGFFKSLEEIVHFYNTRDVNSSWPLPEVAANVNTGELGDLELSFEVSGVCMVYDGKDNQVEATDPDPPCEEELIVTFMKTLSDIDVTP
jgi:cytochrome c peroxidase